MFRHTGNTPSKTTNVCLDLFAHQQQRHKPGGGPSFAVKMLPSPSRGNRRKKDTFCFASGKTHFPSWRFIVSRDFPLFMTLSYLESDLLLHALFPACSVSSSFCLLTVSHQTLTYSPIMTETGTKKAIITVTIDMYSL